MPWNHSICDHCWDKFYGADRGSPVRISERRTETCCFCGTSTRSGIYVRADPRIPKYCPKAPSNGKEKNAV